MTEKKFKVQAEVVSGKCPTCDEFTTLVGIDKAFYRCMSCFATGFLFLFAFFITLV